MRFTIPDMMIHGYKVYIHKKDIHGISMDIPCISTEKDIHGISMDIYHDGISIHGYTWYIRGISMNIPGYS